MAEIRRRRPVLRYDFSQGYIAKNLPPDAVTVMRNSGIGTNRMEAELRSYINWRGIEEVLPHRILQIVSRYVDVHPVSFTEMERALGSHFAREAMLTEVPLFTWFVQDFLDYIDVRVGYRHRSEINRMIESMIAKNDQYRRVSARHLRSTGYTVTDVIRHEKEHGRRYNTTPIARRAPSRTT